VRFVAGEAPNSDEFGYIRNLVHKRNAITLFIQPLWFELSNMSEDVQQIILWLIPAAPLISAIITALLGPKLLRYKSHLPCWSAIAVSFCVLVDSAVEDSAGRWTRRGCGGR
jgi:hypothetical protein